jgi:Tfp pilus assembly protein PilO
MSFKKLRVMFMLPIAVLMFALGWLFLWIDDLQRLKKGRLVISAHKGMALTIEKNADNSATIHKA